MSSPATRIYHAGPPGMPEALHARAPAARALIVLTASRP